MFDFLAGFDWPAAILITLAAYLIGSIPVSLIVGKLTRGVDVRDYGSGNPGTTNAIRVLGRRLGYLVFALDLFKGGLLILLICLGLFDAFSIFHPLFYGIVTVLGHIFPLFLRFKGGRGVATSVGVFLFYVPGLGLIGLLGFILALRATLYVSVGSCTGAASLLLASLVVYFAGPAQGDALEVAFGFAGDPWMPAIALIGNILIFYRHRGNFRKIKAGTEPKTTFFDKNQ